MEEDRFLVVVFFADACAFTGLACFWDVADLALRAFLDLTSPFLEEVLSCLSMTTLTRETREEPRTALTVPALTALPEEARLGTWTFKMVPLGMLSPLMEFQDFSWATLTR